jgi:hypothetical protein
MSTLRFVRVHTLTGETCSVYLPKRGAWVELPTDGWLHGMTRAGDPRVAIPTTAVHDLELVENPQ